MTAFRVAFFLGAAGALSTIPAVDGGTPGEDTTADERGASAETGPARMQSPPDCFNSLEINVWEDCYGVQINIEAEDDESDHLSRFGMPLELDGGDVDELIAALEAFR